MLASLRIGLRKALIRGSPRYGGRLRASAKLRIGYQKAEEACAGRQMQILLQLDRSLHDRTTEARNGDLENAAGPLACLNLNRARTVHL